MVAESAPPLMITKNYREKSTTEKDKIQLLAEKRWTLTKLKLYLRLLYTVHIVH